MSFIGFSSPAQSITCIDKLGSCYAEVISLKGEKKKGDGGLCPDMSFWIIEKLLCKWISDQI